MPKKTVRITIPVDSPHDLALLVKAVWDKHAELGASSPLAGDLIINMTRYEELMTEALAARKQAVDLHHRAQALMGHSRVLFGIDAGQTLSTEDTLYHFLNNIKHFLLVKHRGLEEDLSVWGFNVVLGTSSVGAKKKKKKE